MTWGFTKKVDSIDVIFINKTNSTRNFLPRVHRSTWNTNQLICVCRRRSVFINYHRGTRIDVCYYCAATTAPKTIFEGIFIEWEILSSHWAHFLMYGRIIIAIYSTIDAMEQTELFSAEFAHPVFFFKPNSRKWAKISC